ncbi:MAG: RluA family pseudouridine synthase [Pirellula sp.]|nr:RluA family pseudouridine synthase [Pirellula sp.]
MSSSSKFQLIHLAEEDAGSTLSNVLKRRLENRSWGDVREMILKRRVQVNGNLCLDAARKVTGKDVIKVWKESLPKPVEPTAIKLVYVDDYLVVVEKPPAVTSTRHIEERDLPKKRRQLQPTLEELIPDALMHHFQSFRKAQPPTPTRKMRIQETARQKEHRMKRYSVIAVHRLDRDTSGLMIFARTPSIAQALGIMFRKHEVVRKYHAVVLGHPKAQTFDNILVRDRGDGVRGSKPGDVEDSSAQRAITHIRPIEKIGDYSMIECQLETGRTHQIRIHLSEAGHLLCGDLIYGRNRDGTRTEDPSNAPRQALHSATLEFKHPVSGEDLKFKMPWPADLYQWLQQLRKNAK